MYFSIAVTYRNDIEAKFFRFALNTIASFSRIWSNNVHLGYSSWYPTCNVRDVTFNVCSSKAIKFPFSAVFYDNISFKVLDHHYITSEGLKMEYLLV